MIHPNVLILLISCWVVAVSLMAKKTNMGVAVFVSDNIVLHMYTRTDGDNNPLNEMDLINGGILPFHPDKEWHDRIEKAVRDGA